MIILGVILLLIGYFTGLSLLYGIGGILVVVGVVLWLLGAVVPRSVEADRVLAPAGAAWRAPVSSDRR